MTYLIAFVLLGNMHIELPIVVHGSIQSCEAAKIKLTKEIQLKAKTAIVVATCLDR